MTSNKIDQLIQLADMNKNDRIRELEQAHKEFIEDIQFLRQRFEVERINPHNHRITFKSRYTNRRIFYPYNNFMLDDDVIRIMDELTYPEAVRRLEKKPNDKVVDEKCETAQI